MPASPSINRGVERSRPARRWTWLLLAVIVMVPAASVFILPASAVQRLLPARIEAGEFSGSFMHGAAGMLRVDSRDAGAVEWQLHPLALLRLALAADIHWVKGGFVIDAAVEITRRGASARGLKGSGPLENLHDFGIPAGWRGIADLDLPRIDSDFSGLLSILGTIQVANLSSAAIASSTDLGGYVLEFAPAADGRRGEAENTLVAALHDTGGPIELLAHIQFSPATHIGTLSGTIKERSETSPALRHELDNLAQLHPRDANGRFPVELEFTL